MRNYIKILNFSDFPEVKGLHVSSGRLERTFCSCGFVECSIIKKCPSCGNEDFISSSKTMHGASMIPASTNSYEDPYSILQSSYGYDIRKNQAAATNIVKTNRHSYTTLVSQCSIATIKPFMDTEEFRSVHVYEVARKVCESMDSDESWKNICRLCFKLYQEYPVNFNEKIVNKFLDCIGRDEVNAKIENLMNYGYKLTMKDVMSIMESLPPITYEFCANHYVFSALICREYSKKISNLPEQIQEVLYAYWKGGYLSDHIIAEVFKVMCDVGVKESNIDNAIKFFKEEYSVMHNNPTGTSIFRQYLETISKSKTPITNKEFFLGKSKKVIAGTLKKSDYSESLFDDVYTDPASVFINIAKIGNQ